eukprot:5291240-Prymnesium_polylepis.3
MRCANRQTDHWSHSLRCEPCERTLGCWERYGGSDLGPRWRELWLVRAQRSAQNCCGSTVPVEDVMVNVKSHRSWI